MIRSLLLASVLVVAPAAAQEASKEAPAPAPPKPPAAPATERPSLNLRLDNPSSWATTAPAGKEAAKGLPTLGGDARRIESKIPSESTSFPKDTNPNN